ncbi:S-adenosyl-L-methionine-dependent methyltransferase [Dichotomocladium elegans]|nr:S-adenosyl-L-methionine-dependent methyltransferase [Dichotomocladium elegans]
MGAQLSKIHAPLRRHKRKNTYADNADGITESSKLRSKKKDKAVRQISSAGALSQESPRSPSATSYPSLPRRTRAATTSLMAPSVSYQEDPDIVSTPSFVTEYSITPLSVASTHSDKQSEYCSPDLDLNQYAGDPSAAEQEYNRQLRQHYVFKQVIGANIKYDFEKPPENILDSTCGAGFWVFEVAQMFPNSKVVAMNPNVAPSQYSGPSTGCTRLNFPNNVSFVHAEIQLPPLPFPENTFDLIHQREAGLILPTLAWEPLITDFYRILKPGGVIHIVDYDLCYPPCGPLSNRVNDAIERLTADRGFNIYHTKQVETLMRQEGFEDVKVQGFPVPIGEWPKDEVKLQQGFLLKSMVLGLLRWVKPHLCNFLDIEQEEYEQFCAALIDEVEINKGSTEWKVLTGRKRI